MVSLYGLFGDHRPEQRGRAQKGPYQGGPRAQSGSFTGHG
jgi:hypothetical protein